MALTEEYRPKKWEHFLGQDIAVKYLKKLVDEIITARKNGTKLPQKSILIHGPFGTSKTSFARMFARSVFCKDKNPENPCLKCLSCQSDYPTSDFAYWEIDCSKTTWNEELSDALGKKDMRSKMTGGIVVLVFDEAQELKDMKKLLKPIEQAANGVIVFFLTTNPEKIDSALKSRCVEIETHLLSVPDSMKLLEKICNDKKWIADNAALRAISLKSLGHPRDIVKNLETVQEYAYAVDNFNGKITMEGAIEVLNLTPPEWLLKVFIGIFTGGLESDIFKIVDIVPESPKEKHDLIKEFALFIGFKMRGEEVDIKTEFHYFKPDMIKSMINAFEAKVKSLRLNAHKAWDCLIEFISFYSIKTDADWHMFLRELNELVNMKNFVLDKSDGGFISISSPRFKNRKIVHK
ncbi:MAG: AAA family ATPase [Rickettsiales bacterium]|jgi:DNA polymerase III gamma/tau subunit|nr:AAA family ATPase [Rickettsiales bacterium]